MLPTTANCLLSFICSANTVTLWKRWGCMWLHMWGNHQNSFLCLSSMSSPSSSSSVPAESRKVQKSKGRRGAQCLKAVANPLLTESLYCITHPKVGAVCRCWDKRVSGAYLCGRISLRSPSWRWNLGLKFSAYSGCSVKPVWIKGKRNVHIFSSVTCLCVLLVPSWVWRGIADGAQALFPSESSRADKCSSFSVYWSSSAKPSSLIVLNDASLKP